MPQAQMVELVSVIANAIDEKWISLLIKTTIIGVGVLLFKAWVESIAAYATFRLNSFIKIGTLIMHKGERARIKEVSWCNIVLETEKGFISVPMKGWRTHLWTVLKDKPIGED